MIKTKLELAETEKAYLAGLFDGEGTLGYYWKPQGKHGYHLPQLAIYNCDPRVMAWITERLAIGRVYDSANKRTKYKGWQWSVSSKPRIQEFLTAIRPYLVIKADQVDLLLSLWDAEKKICRVGKRLSQDTLTHRQLVEARLRILKTAHFAKRSA